MENEGMKKFKKRERETVLRDKDTEWVVEGKERIPVTKVSLLTKNQVVFMEPHDMPSRVLTFDPRDQCF